MKKILAIDDNQINLELLHQIVKMYYPDFLFLKTISGKRGIELAMEESPEIILLDILMPEMDGIEASLKIREWEQANGKSRIPIIAMTANAMQEDRNRCRAVGMDDYISKPVQSKILEEILSRWVMTASADSRVQAAGVQAEG